MSLDEGGCAIAECSLMILVISQFMQRKQGGEKIQPYQGSEVHRH